MPTVELSGSILEEHELNEVQEDGKKVVGGEKLLMTVNRMESKNDLAFFEYHE